MKLNLGAGNDIRPGYVNHDITRLNGIDKVHNLNRYPWPWKANTFEEIIANDVLEHLDDFMPAMEEIFRILKPGGIARIRVPYWNSVTCHADPTHKRGFHELRFRFFDPANPWCQERPYYTHARFEIVKEHFIIAPFFPYFPLPGLREVHIHRKIPKRIIGFLGNLFSNIILDLDIELKKIPSYSTANKTK